MRSPRQVRVNVAQKERSGSVIGASPTEFIAVEKAAQVVATGHVPAKRVESRHFRDREEHRNADTPRFAVSLSSARRWDWLAEVRLPCSRHLFVGPRHQVGVCELVGARSFEWIWTSG